MSLIQNLKEKIKKSLSDIFNAQSPLPEPVVQKEMEQEGWTFDYYIPMVGAYHIGGGFPIVSVKTPEGRPAYNGGAAPSDEALFHKTVAEKRVKHGLQP